MQSKDLKWLFSLFILLNVVFVFSDPFDKALESIEKKEYGKALEIYYNLLKKDKNNHVLINNIGVVFFKKNEYTEAYKYFDRSCKLKPDYKTAFYNKGLVLFITSQWLKLLDYVENIKKRFPEQGDDLRLLQTYCYYRLRRFEEAKNIFSTISERRVSSDYLKLYTWVYRKIRLLK